MKNTRSEKVVLIGCQGTGKTSIVTKFCKDTFTPNMGSTVGAAFNSKVIKTAEQYVQLDIWDTAGSEKYRSLAPMYYRDARAAIVVISVTDPDSLSEASEWISKIREDGRSDCVFVFAINKCDLSEKAAVNVDQIADFAFKHQVNFYRCTSARTGEGITELFDGLVAELMKLPPLVQPKSEVDELLAIPQGSGNENNNQGCC